MNSATTCPSVPAAPDAVPPATLRSRLVQFVIRRRVPISILVFGSLIVEDIISRVVPQNLFDFTNPKAMLGLTCVLLGVAIRSWAAGFLIKDSELTTSGPYAMIRNPLYLGSFLMIAGFCLVLNDPENLWIAPIALLLIYLPKVHSEERGLSSRFPEAWQHYSSRTPRFFPRSFAWPRLAGWRLSQWRKSREYKALFACLAGLAALQLLHEMYQ